VLEDLDDVPWAELGLTWAPSLLRAYATQWQEPMPDRINPQTEEIAAGWMAWYERSPAHELEQRLFPDNRLTPATPYVVPVLVEIAVAPATRWRRDVLGLLLGIVARLRTQAHVGTGGAGV
jgi:hypothetical protein